MSEYHPISSTAIMHDTLATTRLFIFSEEEICSMKVTPRVCLLIPTIEGRETYLMRLIRSLRFQMKKYNGEVVALILKDNREMSIGAKRNKLMDWALMTKATHRAFIDDDDTVTPDYIDLNIEGARQGFDCNSLRGIYSVNGVVDPRKHIFIHSLKYTHWYEDSQYYYRNPNHLNWVKIDKVKHVRFVDQNFGEDGKWSEEIARQNLLQSEYHIDKPFYNYLFRTKVNGI